MKKLIVVPLAALAVLAPAALAKPHHFLKVSPSSVKAGKTITVHGKASNCAASIALLSSKAFVGATQVHHFGGKATTIDALLMGNGKIAVKVTLSMTLKKGTYKITGTCAAVKFGSATLKVT